ncbi:hypothetical protein Terro_3295 [Terriglobus roseus DSM 18391]|uniref:DUF308 domain-containing protein n=1 Tax=Terriglobus roseus (strain DSM 18391 / NRRL B-41598 / KBS 63) TaxID=926566 RepID=I3ZJU4_TERRK|nr:hypothetical protein [Terriglobus roseus]AFL89512.1 hypothetical protein Terro_3295 [Terriglobus roseus DSM 18391]
MSITYHADQSQAHSLRNLYFTRTAVQLLWAAIVIATSARNPPLAAGLLILYPLWDVACTVFDMKSFTRSGPSTAHYVNVVLGTLAAIGMGLTAFKTPQQGVVIFGGWAFVAGVAQLAISISRRKELGGQWAMILSGLQSAAAGAAFILGGLHDKTHIKDLGGYAIFGGVYFLIAGLLMHRRLSRESGNGAVATGQA